MEFIETLLVKDGEIQNLKYHLKRMEKTYNYFKWKMENGKWKIDDELKMENGKWRIRITYNQHGIQKIEIYPIKERIFKKFKIVKINFDYKFKYKNRNSFSILHYPFSIDIDELILVKNNLITDSTISNLAFFTGKEWITPKFPLLKGTKREELIQKGFLKETNIHISDLKYFKKIAMINAILGFFEIEDFDIIK